MAKCGRDRRGSEPENDETRLRGFSPALSTDTEDLLLAQQLLRHESVATTQAYLHPTRDDLSDALASLKLWRSAKDDLAQPD
jgi:hypothetical protein